MDEFISLISELVRTPGASGFEDEIAKVVADKLRPFVDELNIDQLANVIGTKRGSGGLKIMVDAHIDEPALIVKDVEPNGYLRVERSGFVHVVALLAQKVNIHPRDGSMVKGVVGVKGSHLYFAEPSSSKGPSSLPILRDIYIDIGCKNAEDVGALGVEVGNPITLDSELQVLSNQQIAIGKAMDNRALVGVLIETMKQLSNLKMHNTIYAVGSTMEEIGARGIRSAASRILPDIWISLDVTVSADTPDADYRDFPVSVGKGPVITLSDAQWDVVEGMIPHPALREHFIATAKREHIPYQVEVVSGPITNALAAHSIGLGIPSAAIKVPIRYSHTAIETISLDDLRACIKLVVSSIIGMDEGFRLQRS